MTTPAETDDSYLKPTRRLRWRELPLEAGKQFTRSILEQLWVNDGVTLGVWRPVPRVPEDAQMRIGPEALVEFF